MRKLLNSLVLAFAVITWAVSPVLAAVTATPVFVQTPKLGLVQFLQGTDSAGTYKTAYTGGANGSKITGLVMNTNDGTATHLVTCQIVRTAVFYGGVAATTVLSAGFVNGTPAQNLLALWTGLPLDSDGNAYLYLANASDTLQCTFATALTASTLINVQVVAADF